MADAFVENLARRFSVLTFDNRGTGLSEKPAYGYSLDIMAADVAGLLDSLGWASAHVLGFSMGGAIAQELAIRNPERVARLVLFATFPGGLFGIPAPWPVLRRLFGIEGLSPEEAARQVWPVTYSAAYLATQPDAVEAQMRREIAYPTPDHAARGQGAAIRAFSSALRLSQIRAETLVATGTEDALVPPGNSRILASRTPSPASPFFPVSAIAQSGRRPSRRPTLSATSSPAKQSVRTVLRLEVRGAMVDLRSILPTLSVAEHLSFRRAGAALGLRRSAVSRRVRG